MHEIDFSMHIGKIPIRGQSGGLRRAEPVYNPWKKVKKGQKKCKNSIRGQSEGLRRSKPIY